MFHFSGQCRRTETKLPLPDIGWPKTRPYTRCTAPIGCDGFRPANYDLTPDPYVKRMHFQSEPWVWLCEATFSHKSKITTSKPKNVYVHFFSLYFVKSNLYAGLHKSRETETQQLSSSSLLGVMNMDRKKGWSMSPWGRSLQHELKSSLKVLLLDFFLYV